MTMLAERGLAVSLGAAEFLTKPVDRARLTQRCGDMSTATASFRR